VAAWLQPKGFVARQRYFDGELPLAVITDPVGLQGVEAYLQRIERGVY